jgi:hypothetical protein
MLKETLAVLRTDPVLKHVLQVQIVQLEPVAWSVVVDFRTVSLSVPILARLFLVGPMVADMSCILAIQPNAQLTCAHRDGRGETEVWVPCKEGDWVLWMSIDDDDDDGGRKWFVMWRIDVLSGYAEMCTTCIIILSNTDA